MIYYFTYRYGELEAIARADTELEAWTRLFSGKVPITVNINSLDGNAWDLQDIEEEEHDR